MSKQQIIACAKRGKKASFDAARLTTAQKNRVLLHMAALLLKNEKGIQKANQKDLKAAAQKRLSAALTDRLTLNKKRISEMSRSLKTLAKLPDPVGETVDQWKTAAGLRVSKVRIPLGLIGIIFESRPDVTVDTAAICLKAGNAVILRGGSEAYHSNRFLSDLFRSVLIRAKVNPDMIQIFPTVDRKDVPHFLEQDQYIDLLIPRGGEGLMGMVRKLSKIPTVKHDKGVCHTFVDKDADLKMARKIVMNAKTQRLSTCNTLECLLVDKKTEKKFLPPLLKDLREKGIKIRKGSRYWGKEFLGPELAVRVVKDCEAAVAHIREYGSLHTEAIITQNKKRARRFLDEVLASAVMVNASTRLNDGFQLGLGAEVGISTTKLHAFGPMGLKELTTTKYVVEGRGQIRK